MTDLVADVRKGVDLQAAAAAIAPDYGFHPSLLVRKFNEAYPDGLPPVASRVKLRRLERAIYDHNMRELGRLAEAMAKQREEARIRKHLRHISTWASKEG